MKQHQHKISLMYNQFEKQIFCIFFNKQFLINNLAIISVVLLTFKTVFTALHTHTHNFFCNKILNLLLLPLTLKLGSKKIITIKIY